MGGDTTSLFYTATALLRLQQRFGGVETVLAVGRAAGATCGILARLRHGLQVSQLPRSGGKLGSIVVFDRAADLVTPLLTQMTYEGLIDELLGITNGMVEFEKPPDTPVRETGGASTSGAGTSAGDGRGARPQMQRAALNSSDKVFREIRDLSYAAAAAWIREKAATMQQDYRSLDAHAQSMQGVKAFVKRLHTLPELQRHTSIAETLSTGARDEAFMARIRAEQSLLEGGSQAGEMAAEVLEGMMVDRKPLESVLRLLCLATHTPGGVPRRSWEGLCRALLHSYGHEHSLTLQDLRKAGLVCPKDGGKSPYTVLKRPLGLLVDALDERNPDDAAYVYGGYAPICVRVVERWLKGTLPADAVKQATGVCFEMKQTVDARGVPVETRADVRPTRQRGGSVDDAGGSSASPAPAPGALVVVFLGGVCPAEISALRHLEKRGLIPGGLVVLTTKVINGNSLVRSLVPAAVQRADLLRQSLAEKWAAVGAG